MSTPPLPLRWNGETFEPVSARFSALANKHLVVGEVYTLVEEEPRSMLSHRHEFAWIRDAWMNLPEGMERDFPNPEALRKYALIKAGYCDVQTYTCGSVAEAKRWAENLRPLDEFSIIDPVGTTVRRYTARSQSRRAMMAKEFQESKTAILNVIAEMLNVSPQDLQENGGKAE